jgi:hypothetical protein
MRSPLIIHTDEGGPERLEVSGQRVLGRVVTRQRPARAFRVFAGIGGKIDEGKGGAVRSSRK